MATSQIDYYFRQGRKETNPGILVINKKWEFIVNRGNRLMTTFWYYCKHSKTKGISCDAKATVTKLDLDNGECKFILKEFTEEHKHPGCLAAATAEDMKIEMCKLVEGTPENPVSVARKDVILKYAEIFEDKPGLWSEIVQSIGDYDAVDKRLLRARQKVIGNAPKNRNEFDPTKIIEDGEDIIVLDSNHLPRGWKILI